MFAICAIAAFFASTLTFFSGFGLGTLLTPVFMIFFPLEIAVAMTAVVHFANNGFKFLLLKKHLDKNILLKFGVPAIFAALLGAWALSSLGQLDPLTSWSYAGKVYFILPLKLIMALVMVFFVFWELFPKTAKLQVDEKYLPVGGILSGFFGGLSGHQGALRSAFLGKVSGITKESFLITGISIGILVDISRLLVYSQTFLLTGFQSNILLIVTCVLSSFAGALVGHYVFKKMTLKHVQTTVSWLLLVLALALGLGLV